MDVLNILGWVLLIMSIFVIAAVGAAYYKRGEEERRQRRKNDELRHKIEQTDVEKKSLEERNAFLTQQVEEWKNQANAAMSAKGTVEEDVNGLLEKKKELEGQLQDLEENRRNVEDEIEKNRERLKELEKKCAELGKRADSKEKLDEIEEEMDDYRLEGLSGKEEHLIEMLNEIAYAYPSLKEDLMGIAWKRIWLGKMQDYIKKQGWADWGGIYCIKRISDGKCYIGQAVDFKNRWYQHAKKMIGMDSSGDEKLYNGGEERPDHFYWYLLDAYDDPKSYNDKEYMNKSEKWWIDYLGAELNKKR